MATSILRRVLVAAVVAGAWLALALCRSLKTSIKSCIATLGIAASPDYCNS